MSQPGTRVLLAQSTRLTTRGGSRDEQVPAVVGEVHPVDPVEPRDHELSTQGVGLVDVGAEELHVSDVDRAVARVPRRAVDVDAHFLEGVDLEAPRRAGEPEGGREQSHGAAGAGEHVEGVLDRVVGQRLDVVGPLGSCAHRTTEREGVGEVRPPDPTLEGAGDGIDLVDRATVVVGQPERAVTRDVRRPFVVPRHGRGAGEGAGAQEALQVGRGGRRQGRTSRGGQAGHRQRHDGQSECAEKAHGEVPTKSSHGQYPAPWAASMTQSPRLLPLRRLDDMCPHQTGGFPDGAGPAGGGSWGPPGGGPAYPCGP